MLLTDVMNNVTYHLAGQSYSQHVSVAKAWRASRAATQDGIMRAEVTPGQQAGRDPTRGAVWTGAAEVNIIVTKSLEAATTQEIEAAAEVVGELFASLQTARFDGLSLESLEFEPAILPDDIQSDGQFTAAIVAGYRGILP